MPAQILFRRVKRLLQRAFRARHNADITRLARNVAWSSFGVVLSQVITLVAYMLLARVIGREHFGHFAIIQSTANTVSVFAGLGLGVTATKYIAALRDREPQRAGAVFALIGLFTVAWTSLMAVSAWLWAPQIAAEVLQKGDLTAAVRIGAVLLFFTTVLNVQNGALLGFESFDAAAMTTLLRGFLVLLLLLTGAKLDGTRGALLGFTSATVLTCFIDLELLRRRCRRFSMPLTLRGSRKELRFLAAFSIPAFLINIVPAPCFSLAQMYLIRFPGGYGDLAVFAAAFQLRAGIILLPNLLSQPLVPMMASASHHGESSRQSLLRATFAATLLVGVGLAAIVCTFPKYLMLAYGHAFTGNTSILALLSVSAVISSVTTPFTAAVTSSGKMWKLSIAYALWGAVFLAMTYGLIPSLKGTAIALAFVIADGVQAVVVYVLHMQNERRLKRDLDVVSRCAI